MKFFSTTALMLALTCSAGSTNAMIPTKTPIIISQDDDDIQENGVLRSVEDAGYPFAILTIEFTERKFSESFTINLEEVKTANMSTLNNWVGKYVSFSYTSEIINDLVDLKYKGKSLMGDEKVEVGPDAKTITGVLKGAKQVTAGDIPDVISVNAMTFEFFITPQMVKANGQTVTATYEEATENTIKKIKVVK